jgi:hypothetical protein
LPPLVAAFQPQLGVGGYAYLSAWQWSFYDPARQALSETLTLWTTIAACGGFVWAVSNSALRTLLAVSVAYLGLAWIVVVAPSLVLAGEAARGAAQAWPLRVLLASSFGVLFLASHPGTARTLLSELPRSLGYVAVLWVAAWYGGAELPHVVSCSALLLAVLVATPAPSVREGMERGVRAWPPALAGLVLLALATPMPMLSALGAAILLVRESRGRIGPAPTSSVAEAWLARGFTAFASFALGAAVPFLPFVR